MLIDKRTTTSVSAAAKQQHKLHFPKQNMNCFTKNMEVDSHTLFHFIIAKLKTWRTAFPVSRTPQRISWGRIFNYLSKSVHSPMRKVCQLFLLPSFPPSARTINSCRGHWQASIKCLSLQLHVDNIITSVLLLLFRLLLLLLLLL